VHKRNIFLLSIIFFLPGIVWGYPSNQWQHAETEHFFISTNEKTHHLLSEASLIAEQIAATFADYFDEEVIKRADELGVAMVFSGVRGFRH